MPITNFIADVIFSDNDGLARDEYTNTFAFQGAGSAGVTPSLEYLYCSDAATQTESLGYYISPCVSRTAPVQVRYYDVSDHLDGSPHGAPFQVDNFTLTASGGNGMPEQICVACSFYDALAAAGETTGRHRGRIFLGPLNLEAAVTDTFQHSLPSPTMLDNISKAMANFSSSLVTNAPGVKWSTWSRADAAMRDVQGGFTESTFDVQRKRRLETTSRHSWTADAP